MKCNHCGWNDNGLDTHCIKCGSPLPTASSQPNSSETVRGAAVIAQTAKPTAETIRGASAPGTGTPGAATPSAATPSETTPSETTPNPASPSSTPPAPISRNAGETITGASPSTAPGDHTIDPYRQSPPKEFFLSRTDAKDTPAVDLPFSTTSDTIEVNRANLDADNNTITSKIQAKFTFSEGKWFIVDCSEKQSTFIQVYEQHELKDGDILLIGNKRFVFSSKHPILFRS